MAALSDQPPLSPEEFLAWEAQQAQRHEYLNGQIYGMSGGTLPHNAIAVNLVAGLRDWVRQRKCRLYVNDAKVFISEKGPFFYPDLVVTCDPRDFNETQGLRHPCLIIEVLSPSTQAFDCSEKFRHYRKLDSLQEYVLVASDRPTMDCYYRREPRIWEFESYGPPDPNGSATIADLAALEFQLKSLDFKGPLAMVYEDIAFDLNSPPG